MNVVDPLLNTLKDPDKFVQDTAFSALAEICKKFPIKIYPENIS